MSIPMISKVSFLSLFRRLFCFCFEAISNDLVLITFMESLFPINQDSKRWRSMFRASFNIFVSLDLEHRLVSSAYIETEELFTTYGRSLIYNRNKSGPKQCKRDLRAILSFDHAQIFLVLHCNWSMCLRRNQMEIKLHQCKPTILRAIAHFRTSSMDI